MPLLKSRNRKSVYQRLGDDDEDSDVNEGYDEKVNNEVSSEFTTNNQKCYLTNKSSCNSLEGTLAQRVSTVARCDLNSDLELIRNIDGTSTKINLEHNQESEVLESKLNTLNANFNYINNANNEETTINEPYDTVEDNIYACIDEEIYSTVSDSINNSEDDIYATVDDIYSILDNKDKKSNQLGNVGINDKYGAIVLLDNGVKDGRVEEINTGTSSELGIKPSENKGHPLSSSEPKKTLIPVRKAPPPPIKQKSVSEAKSIIQNNHSNGRKNQRKTIAFPPDVTICKDTVSHSPSQKSSSLDSRINRLSTYNLSPPGQKVISKSKESQDCHESSSCIIGNAVSSICETTATVPKDSLLDITFKSPFEHQKNNSNTKLEDKAPPLPPKQKVKNEVKLSNESSECQRELKVNSSGTLDKDSIKLCPVVTPTYAVVTPTYVIPIEKDVHPECPEILRDLRHGLMKSERPLRETAIFYTKAQPYPDSH